MVAHSYAGCASGDMDACGDVGATWELGWAGTGIRDAGDRSVLFIDAVVCAVPVVMLAVLRPARGAGYSTSVFVRLQVAGLGRGHLARQQQYCGQHTFTLLYKSRP